MDFRIKVGLSKKVKKHGLCVFFISVILIFIRFDILLNHWYNFFPQKYHQYNEDFVSRATLWNIPWTIWPARISSLQSWQKRGWRPQNSGSKHTHTHTHTYTFWHKNGGRVTGEFQNWEIASMQLDTPTQVDYASFSQRWQKDIVHSDWLCVA